MTALKNAAIRYAAVYGWSVFPLGKSGKIPAISKEAGGRGVFDATSDDQQVEAWWSNGYSDSNIGLSCGASGLIVLDFDIDKQTFAGGDLLNQLLDEFPTVTADTGGGGVHMLYRQPDGEPMTNARGVLPVGIDVRGVGGYIVAPPSIHPNGNIYKWHHGRSPGDLEMAPLPDFVFSLIKSIGLCVDETEEAARVARDATTPKNDDGTIARFNSENPITDLLTRHGYRLQGTGGNTQRLIRPGGNSGSVVVFVAENVSYHHSTTDPLNIEKHTRDAFDVWTLLEHAGDKKRAYEAAKRAQGTWVDTPPATESHSTESADIAHDLLADLAELPGDAEAVRAWALDVAPDLADLAAGDYQKFCEALKQRGVAVRWIEKNLKPVVTEAKRASKTAGVSWRDYVRAANRLGFEFKLNTLSDTVEVNGERLSDVTEAKMLSHLHDLGLKSADVARRAFITAADENRYHPIKEFLESNPWDGVDHIGKLAAFFTDSHAPICYADGTQRTAFHAFLRRWLVGAVGKVYDPRVCQNFMLILDGAQDKGKSFFAKWICPIDELHMESPIKTEDKDFMGYLSQKFVWEVGELGSTIRKADREALKAFLTQIDVTFRPAFGRYALTKPALASFIGTVNLDGGLLNDPTGHRRFCPVELTGIDWTYIADVDVKQVWAQAYSLYQSGEAWRLCSEEKAAHAEIVERYEVEDIFVGYIQEWFVLTPGDATKYMTSAKVADRLKTMAGVRGADRAISMQVSSAMQKLGVEKRKKGDQNAYFGIAPTE